jgi:mRNA-degrading endonuclease RelE of RelBE toxin-antitoxin system
LPKEVQKLADKNYRLLKLDPTQPSLHFKKVGKNKQLWSVRVGINYRALGIEKNEGIVWFWIGNHAEYDKILS